MKPPNVPRQPFVGLAMTAAVGIAVAEIVPLRSTVLISAAIILALCVVLAFCWPKLPVTYLLVAIGFLPLHNLATTNTPGQQLADKVGERPRAVTVVGRVLTQPKMASSGFATFLLKLRSIEFGGQTE